MLCEGSLSINPSGATPAELPDIYLFRLVIGGLGAAQIVFMTQPDPRQTM